MNNRIYVVVKKISEEIYVLDNEKIFLVSECRYLDSKNMSALFLQKSKKEFEKIGYELLTPKSAEPILKSYTSFKKPKEKQVSTPGEKKATIENKQAKSVSKPLTPDELLIQKQDQEFLDMIFIFIKPIFIGLVLVSFFLVNTGKTLPCSQQIEAAWNECNNDYNGKCHYLGEKYRPSCMD